MLCSLSLFKFEMHTLTARDSVRKIQILAPKETSDTLEAMMRPLNGYLLGSSLSSVCANTISEAIVACALSRFQLVLVTDTVFDDKKNKASILPFLQVSISHILSPRCLLNPNFKPNNAEYLQW